MNILFICKGNVGRSMMAEAFARAKNIPQITIASAGTKLSGPEMTMRELRPGTDNVIEVMKEKGIEVESHVRRNVTEKMIQDADSIISMADPETEPTHLREHTKLTRWQVEDPKEKDIETTRHIRDSIERLVETLLKVSI